MFKHILVPLDGSLQAERAIPVAARIARECQGTLILVRVVQDSSADTSTGSETSPLFQKALHLDREEAQQYLARASASRAITGLPTILSTPQGAVIPAICSAIATYQADLLVCTELSTPPNSPQTTGTFVQQLCPHLTLPLLLLPAHDELYGSLGDVYLPLTCQIAFTSTQPEPFLIPPASALLTVLAGRGPRHMRLAPLRLIASRIATPARKQEVPAAVAASQEVSRAGAALLQTPKRAQKHDVRTEQDQRTFVVLNMASLCVAPDDSLQMLCTAPRLFVPDPVHQPDAIQA